MTYRQQWKDQGYLVVPKAFDADRVARLFEGCESAFEQWKRDSREHNQPFGYCYAPNAWTLIHVNHPMYYQGQPGRLARLLDAVADPSVMRILGEVFTDDAILLQINYYIDPPGETRIGAWHRDCQFYPGADEAAQRRAVAEEADPPRELHMHIPLVPTEATEVVPGSHNRWDTPEEARLKRDEPQTDRMPNALRIKLVPGDLAFFHVNSIHRGLYHKGVPRRTIAVSFGRASNPRKATPEIMKSWRGYVASYQPWFLNPSYLEGCRPESRKFFQKFVEVYRDSWKPEYLSELSPELQAYFTKW